MSLPLRNTPPTAQTIRRLRDAEMLLRQGQSAPAARLLREAVMGQPDCAVARRLYGVSLLRVGDASAAKTEFQQSLVLDPTCGPSAIALSEMALDAGKPTEALAVIAPLAKRPGADIHVLTAQGDALKALGSLDLALAAYRQASRAEPTSAVADHNVASTLANLERFAEADAAAGRALAKGLNAPETWLVRARARLGLRQYDASEDAYRQVLRLRPNQIDAQAELAQLIWMRTEDVDAALVDMFKAMLAYPDLDVLAVKAAEVLDFAGRPEAAFALIADYAARPGAWPVTHVTAARLAARLTPERAVAYAQKAVDRLPGDAWALTALCEARLAAGDTVHAAEIAEHLHRADPLDQHRLALLSTAWRLIGDPRRATLSDYPGLVGTEVLDTPDGWPTLSAFLGDLKTSLDRLHGLRTHPIGQSVRHGSQTSQSLNLSDDPVIQAFFRAVDGPLRRGVARLGSGDDPVRSRNTGGYQIQGAWSIRLRPDGFHANHVHSKGWLSSACYIALPAAVDRGQEGWLKFGEPGIPTAPALAPDHFIKPEPGRLALFPSFMWHGTVPFTGDESRMTIAFDIVPA